MLVECPRAGDAGVQVEQAAGLGGGERDQVTPGLVGYEWRRGVCSRRGERAARSCQAPFSAGAGQADLAVTARKAWASIDKVMCRYQAR